MIQSHTTTVLRMLSEGELSAKEMASRSGLSQRQVEYAMQQLRKGYAIRAMNRPYQITKEGEKILGRRVEAERKLAEKAERAAEEERQRAEKIKAEEVAKVRDLRLLRAAQLRKRHADEARQIEAQMKADRERIATLAEQSVRECRTQPNSVFALGNVHA